MNDRTSGFDRIPSAQFIANRCAIHVPDTQPQARTALWRQDPSRARRQPRGDREGDRPNAGRPTRPRHAGAGLQREIDGSESEGGWLRIADPGEETSRCAGRRSAGAGGAGCVGEAPLMHEHDLPPRIEYLQVRVYCHASGPSHSKGD